MVECSQCGKRDDDWFLCRKEDCAVKTKPYADLQTELAQTRRKALEEVFQIAKEEADYQRDDAIKRHAAGKDNSQAEWACVRLRVVSAIIRALIEKEEK